MKCPKCNSTSHRKNGHRRGKQCYQCRVCGRQFVKSPLSKSYPLEVKQLCLKMYLNGMGLRGIERVTEIHHRTIMNWIEEAGMELPDTPEEEEIPEITEIDELQTFIGNKKKKVWIWTVVNHWQPGILLWTVGGAAALASRDRSSETFKHLWLTIKCWHSFWYVSDGYPVYPCFIEPEDHLVSKTYMTRVEGENTRLRHYLARLHRKTLCYSKSIEMLKYSIRLLLHYLKFKTVPAIA
jgi:IS1 family transposase/transposase-like protein